MAKALLITPQDVVAMTSLNGTTEIDKFIQYVSIAQDIHIQNYTGTNLLEKIQDDIINDALSGNYLMITEKYLKPMLIHWAMVEYLPFAAYTIANKGVYKHGAENSESVQKNEVDYLVGKEKTIAENYSQRFVDYMCIYSYMYPEYLNNSNEKIYPSSNVPLTGWYL